MTKRVVDKLQEEATRIPIHWDSEKPLLVDDPYVLLTPSYGSGKQTNTVPKQVIKFLNIKSNRDLCRGVIGSGNKSYGSRYCSASYQVSDKLHVPVLFTYELLATPDEIKTIKELLKETK